MAAESAPLTARERQLLPALLAIGRVAKKMPTGYAGTRLHKVNPNTVIALESRGWVRTKIEHRVIVARLSDAGRDLLIEHANDLYASEGVTF